MRLALERLALLVAQDRILGRFPQGDVDEAGARGQAAVLPEDPARGFDLLPRQRVQRVPHPDPDLPGRRHRPLLPGSRATDAGRERSVFSRSYRRQIGTSRG